MKNLHYTLLLFSILLFHFSCSNTLQSEGEVKEKQIKLNEFSKLELSGNYQVFLIYDTLTRLTVEAPQNIIENLEILYNKTEVEIKEKQEVDSDDFYKIYLYCKAPEKIKMKENVNLDISGQLRFVEMDLELHNNAKLIAQVFGEKITLSQHDNSNINLTGTISTLHAKIYNHADFHSPLLITTTANMVLKDEATANLQIIKSLDGSASNRSVLEYKGNPDKNFKETEQATITKLTN